MLLRLSARFDPRRDAAPWLAAQPLAADTFLESLETLHAVNVERNGNIIYTWKETRGHTCIGVYDPNSQTNEHLYTFEKDLHMISCSVNNEKTLLAVSFLQSTKEVTADLLFQPVSKCLTLLIEISPVNNVKVLKAVDNCISVQFLYPVAETHTIPESCLLLISEDKYVEKIDIRLVKEGHAVVMENSSHLSKEKIADDFIWIQWDTLEQRLFYIVPEFFPLFPFFCLLIFFSFPRDAVGCREASLISSCAFWPQQPFSCQRQAVGHLSFFSTQYGSPSGGRLLIRAGINDSSQSNWRNWSQS